MKSIEKILEQYLPKSEGYSRALTDAMSYSVMVGGKRIRPTLMLKAYELYGGQEEVIEPFMAAIEMIHAYGLVHDDLPAMDCDELRHGRSTTWKKYGEALGILTGDGLLTLAFETAAKAFALTKYPERASLAFGILAERAGYAGMLGGQVVDVTMSGKAMPEDELDFVYRRKTGALIEAALLIGAGLAGAQKDDLAALSSVAQDVGMAFQIRDDILDVISTEEELGKPVGSDEENGKTTYVTLHGLKRAQLEVENRINHARETLESLQVDTTDLRGFISGLIMRKF